jgi:putative heme-binding domain-containing protein
MARSRTPEWLALVFLASVGAHLVADLGPLAAQAPPPPAGASNPAANNPHLGNAQSIRSGLALYRIRCGDCHGLDASGYRGPDLVSLMSTDVTDQRLFQTMRNGVPGTEMPPSNAPDDDLLMTIAYLRKLGTAAPAERPSGNVDNGERLFAAQCASCHRVAGRGGRLGPDLTRIGVARSRAALIREIRTPSDWVPPGYETVTLVTKDGQRVRGVKKNEDLFSIQVMDLRERIQGYPKADLQELSYETASLMPAFARGRLTDSDLNDLVGYLSTLRGADLLVR